MYVCIRLDRKQYDVSVKEHILEETASGFGPARHWVRSTVLLNNRIKVITSEQSSYTKMTTNCICPIGAYESSYYARVASLSGPTCVVLMPGRTVSERELVCSP
jgi:hypothetical protein